MDKEELKANIVWWICLVVTILLFLTSCGSVHYVPVETVRTEYKIKDSIRYDSIYRLDSVYIKEKGDTVFQEKYKYLYKYLFINKTDTVCKTDTIRVPYPVEAKLTTWQKAKIRGFEVLAGVVLLAIFAWLMRLKLKI